MQYNVNTPEEYIARVPVDRQGAMQRLRAVIKQNLPEGFSEAMSYGMIGYVVPHELYPAGYHCDPTLPLPFMSIASQKNFIAVYHMGIYADKDLLNWFVSAYKERMTTRLDMGKSCIRFKKPELIPFELIGELAGKMSAQDWIGTYEREVKR